MTHLQVCRVRVWITSVLISKRFTEWLVSSNCLFQFQIVIIFLFFCSLTGSKPQWSGTVHVERKRCLSTHKLVGAATQRSLYEWEAQWSNHIDLWWSDDPTRESRSSERARLEQEGPEDFPQPPHRRPRSHRFESTDQRFDRFPQRVDAGEPAQPQREQLHVRRLLQGGRYGLSVEIAEPQNTERQLHRIQ